MDGFIFLFVLAFFFFLFPPGPGISLLTLSCLFIFLTPQFSDVLLSDRQIVLLPITDVGLSSCTFTFCFYVTGISMGSSIFHLPGVTLIYLIYLPTYLLVHLLDYLLHTKVAMA